MIMQRCALFFCCVGALYGESLEEALGKLGESVENLAWSISPITCLEAWTLADINTNPYAPLELSQITPQPSSLAQQIIQPYTPGIQTYIVSVAKQTGTLCGYHAIKNILWLLSALISETPSEAREWLRRMALPSAYQYFQNRMGKKCAATDGEIENFFADLSQEKVFFQELLAQSSVLDALKNDRSVIMSMHLNNSTPAPTNPFISEGYKTGFESAVEEFRKKVPALFPAILYATEDPNPGATSAHFVAILGVDDGTKKALFLCDSLASGRAYGVPSYMELIANALFGKS